MIDILHISLHFIVPAVIVAFFYKKQWQKAYFLLIATMLVDLDHLLASPIYDALRCSINFHPLHQFTAIYCYIGLLLIPKTRLIGLGLLIHILLDSIDCQITNGVWFYVF